MSMAMTSKTIISKLLPDRAGAASSPNYSFSCVFPQPTRLAVTFFLSYISLGHIFYIFPEPFLQPLLLFRCCAILFSELVSSLSFWKPILLFAQIYADFSASLASSGCLPDTSRLLVAQDLHDLQKLCAQRLQPVFSNLQVLSTGAHHIPQSILSHGAFCWCSISHVLVQTPGATPKKDTPNRHIT